MRRVTEGYPYPASSRNDPGSAYDQQLAYDAECDRWARRLTELALRELSLDYMRGARTEEAIDAYTEYKRRESLGLLSHQKSLESNMRASKSRSRNHSRK